MREQRPMEAEPAAEAGGTGFLAAGWVIAFKPSRLRFASSTPTFSLMEMVSFGGGLRWNGHLSQGWRSLAAQDARTATHGSGTRRRSGFEEPVLGCGLRAAVWVKTF